MKLEQQILQQSAEIGGELKRTLIALLVVGAIMLVAATAQEMQTAVLAGTLKRAAPWAVLAIVGAVLLLAGAAALLLLA